LYFVEEFMTLPPSDSLEQVEELLRSGHKDRARDLLTSYLEAYPDSAKAWWLMSYAVRDFNQQYDCLERVLELQPHHRKAQARLAALTSEALPPKSPFASLKQVPISRTVFALVLVAGCVGLAVVGYLGYRVFFSVQTPLPAQADSAQILEASSIVATNMEEALAVASTPTLLKAITQTPPLEVTHTPLVSITPTSNPNATRTPVPENLVGNSAGQYPPDFTLIDAVTNTEVKLYDHFGQPMVIVFLNTLAKECEPEMPGLQAVYEKYQDQGLIVLGIGVGSSQSALRTYTGRFGGLSFILLSDWEHTIARAYEVDRVPTNFFVRKNGKIWQVSYGALTEDELDTAIASLLKVP
jgi:peroxiredoxin